MTLQEWNAMLLYLAAGRGGLSPQMLQDWIKKTTDRRKWIFAKLADILFGLVCLFWGNIELKAQNTTGDTVNADDPSVPSTNKLNAIIKGLEASQKSTLLREEGAWSCPGCSTRFPDVGDVPWLFPDPAAALTRVTGKNRASSSRRSKRSRGTAHGLGCGGTNLARRTRALDELTGIWTPSVYDSHHRIRIRELNSPVSTLVAAQKGACAKRNATNPYAIRFQTRLCVFTLLCRVPSRGMRMSSIRQFGHSV